MRIQVSRLVRLFRRVSRAGGGERTLGARMLDEDVRDGQAVRMTEHVRE